MNPLCPSSPAARVSAYCSTAVLQCCRRHAALHVAACVSPGSAATLCCSRLLVTAALQLLNTVVRVAMCAEAQTSVCW